jgi:predicted anti-sigma-YlaC factor YlaD
VNPFDRLRFGSCEETRDALSDHVDDELRGLRGRRVLRHLARCEHCRALLHSLTRAVEQLRALSRLEPPPAPSLADAVVARIRHGAS